MTEKRDENTLGVEIACERYGYVVRHVEALEEIGSTLFELQHRATGARHIHIANGDSENTFSVAFKTVPSDSTGVAHILEHTVLCGSEKFPVRDPFFSMLKRSLSTFMNAFTASDWTMYPFSTQNRKDFYNLMDVYLDATFFPRIDRLSFKQEGHRLELETGPGETDAHLAYKGVVYNEMKGAMSAPDQVMARSLLNALYPDTTYQYNSGGDPVEIPNLTHAQLRQFHQRHYHPSNAYFYTYGDLPPGEHLAFIHGKILSHFSAIDPKTEVPSQDRWSESRTVAYAYPLEPGDDPAKKSQVCLAWLCADIKNSFEVLVLKLLEQITLGNAASPLRKALIDSGLGSALADVTGFDADNRDTLFACGLKDVDPADADAIEAIVFNTLTHLSDKGIDRELIDTAIHQIEFRRKEITNSPYPFGLKLLLTFSGSWFHGGRPEQVLKFDADILKIREEAAKGGFFESRIRRYFLENRHRVLFTLKPDPTMAAQEMERVRKELAGIQARLNAGELEAIKRDAVALKKLQEETEDVSLLPTLAIEDIPPSVHVVAASEDQAEAPAVCYSQSTSGIFYFTAAMGAGVLTQPHIPLAPFFCYALPKIGTQRRPFTEIVRMVDAHTGGVNLSGIVRTRFDQAGVDGTGVCMPYFAVNGKSLSRNLEKMMAVIAEILLEADFSDLTRLKSLLLEYRAALEAMVVHNGHRLAISLASRGFSGASALSETWGGIHQLKYMKALTEALDDTKLEAVSHDLSAIRDRVINRDNLKIGLVGEEGDILASLGHVAGDGLFAGVSPFDPDDARFAAPALQPVEAHGLEGWSTSTAVSFVAKTVRTVRMGHPDAPVLAVMAKMLRSMYLHREIREKGGAYGGFALYNSETGLFSFASYRDPHILATLEAFEGAARFISSGNYDAEDVKEAILQVCSEIDKPDPPGPAAKKAFYRRLVGLTDDARQAFKKRLLSVGRADIVEAARNYFSEDNGDAGVAVISGEEQLKKANDRITGPALKISRI
ncbi:MAG: insulinase family protein [Deltaproteobacteria bacterium]|nr:insulinase family protein [Deltaproteobacteria bacterium]